MVVSFSTTAGQMPILICKKFLPLIICQIKLSHLAEKLADSSGNISYSNPFQQAFSNSSNGDSFLPVAFSSSQLSCLLLKLLPVKRSISWFVVAFFITLFFSYSQITIAKSLFIIEFCINTSLICSFCNWFGRLINQEGV